MRPETKVVWNVGLLLLGFAAVYWLIRKPAPTKSQEAE
jgi:hypothetical protein